MQASGIRNLALTLGLVVVLGGGAMAAGRPASQPPAGWAGGPGPGPMRGPGDGPGPSGPGIAGAVGTVGSGSFTLTARGTTYTVDLGSSTTYDYGPGLAAARSAVQPNEHVAVSGSVSGGTVTATAVHIQLPHYQGAVTAVSGEAITIQEPSGRTGTMDVSGSVPVAVGQHVLGAGTWQGDTFTARAYEVLPDHAGGTVGSVSGDSAVVTQPDGSTVTVTWTSATSVTPSASAIMAGAHIQAEGSLSGGTLVATAIHVGGR
jgi:hypothetical protein